MRIAGSAEELATELSGPLVTIGTVREVFRELPNCIFCGSAEDMTEEHVLSDWAYRAFHGKRKYADELMFAAKDVPGVGFQFIDANPIGVAKVLCKKCNEQWVSGIDNAASQAIKPLVRTKQRSVVLDRAQQTAVATWLFKCALIVDAVAGDRPHGISKLREGFMEHRHPSPCTIVVGPAESPPTMEVGDPAETVVLWRLGGLVLDGSVTVGVANPDGSSSDTPPTRLAIPGYQFMVGAFWAFMWFQMPTVQGPILDDYVQIWPAQDKPVTVRAASMDRRTPD